MTQELSGVTVVIIIGSGVMTFVLLFIFAKRQIMRFTLRSRRGPHVPIGHDAGRLLKRMIDRRLELIPEIALEPRLTPTNDHTAADDHRIMHTQQTINRQLVDGASQQQPLHHYRMQAIDDMKILESEIRRQNISLVRHPKRNIRSFLLEILCVGSGAGGVAGGGGGQDAATQQQHHQRQIHELCDMYEHARYDPHPFAAAQYDAFRVKLQCVVNIVRNSRHLQGLPGKASPSRSPLRISSQTLHRKSILRKHGAHGADTVKQCQEKINSELERIMLSDNQYQILDSSEVHA